MMLRRSNEHGRKTTTYILYEEAPVWEELSYTTSPNSMMALNGVGICVSGGRLARTVARYGRVSKGIYYRPYTSISFHGPD